MLSDYEWKKQNFIEKSLLKKKNDQGISSQNIVCQNKGKETYKFDVNNTYIPNTCSLTITIIALRMSY